MRGGRRHTWRERSGRKRCWYEGTWGCVSEAVRAIRGRQSDQETEKKGSVYEPTSGSSLDHPPGEATAARHRESGQHTHCPTMPNSTGPRMVSYAAVALTTLLLRCSGFTMTAAPKGPPTSASRGDFLKSAAIGILGAGVGVSAASVAVGRPVLETAEAAADTLVETCEALRGMPRDTVVGTERA